MRKQDREHHKTVRDAESEDQTEERRKQDREHKKAIQSSHGSKNLMKGLDGDQAIPVLLAIIDTI